MKMSTFYRPDDINTSTNRVARAYQQLLVTFDDLRDLADSSGAPRAIVELSTSADEDDAADAAADDGPADAAAVESLAVWSYRHEDGALVNRRSVVVYDDAGPPRGGGGGRTRPSRRRRRPPSPGGPARPPGAARPRRRPAAGRRRPVRAPLGGAVPEPQVPVGG